MQFKCKTDLRSCVSPPSQGTPRVQRTKVAAAAHFQLLPNRRSAHRSRISTEDRLGDDELTCRARHRLPPTERWPHEPERQQASKGRPCVIRRQDIRKRAYLKIRTLGKHA